AEKPSDADRQQLNRLYDGIREDAHALIEAMPAQQDVPVLEPSWKDELKSEQDDFLFQLNDSYIVTRIKKGMMVVDQQAAHERILYERFKNQLEAGSSPSQQSLFPQMIEV